jgi:beta-alanine degradation protein BauB
MFSKGPRVLRLATLSVLSALAGFGVMGTSLAQVAPPSFTASPDIYRVVAENAQYRVIEVTWKPRQRDQFHSHPPGGLFYYVTDCSLRLHRPDGGSENAVHLAGDAGVIPAIDSHSAENVGKDVCKLVLFERK